MGFGPRGRAEIARQDRLSCVDGRDDSGVMGTPGGDAGEFLLALAAVEAAVAALGQRFGPVGLVGAVTPAQVMVAVTGGRLLAPDWPTMR